MRPIQLSLLLVPSLAFADAAGDKGLANVDAAVARTTLKVDYEITHQEAGKPQKTLAANVKRKAGKSLLELTAPADMKGTKVLSLSATELYVFLPAFGKVRRIANGRDQASLGLTTAMDDVLGNGFAQRYTATQNGSQLTGTLRAGAAGCAKLELVVGSDWLPTTLTCTAANGSWTRLTRKSVKVGEAMADDVFSKRSLEK